MSVGIYDADFFKYKQIVINLEAMKISAYYKRKGEIVNLCKTYNPSYFSKNYYIKDLLDGDYNSDIFREENNTQWCGRAFNQVKYKPLDLEIEKMRPDTRLYDKHIKQYGEEIPNIRLFHRMVNANHFRLSLDGETIWEDYRKQLPKRLKSIVFYIHDYNIADIDNGLDELINLQEYYQKKVNRPLSFNTKYPVKIKNHKDIYKIIRLPFKDTTFYIQGIPVGEDLVKLVGLNLGESVYNRIILEPTASYKNEKDFFDDDGPKKLYDIATFLKSNESKISLKYTPNFFSENKWERYIELLNLYIKGVSKFGIEYAKRAANIVTLASFAASSKKKRRSKYDTIPIEEIREIFYFIRDKDSELFRRFYELSRVKLDGKGGFEEWKGTQRKT